MTPQRAKELLPVITAFAEGKQIQFREETSGEWRDCADVGWLSDYEYRIKPEPLTMWGVFSGGFCEMWTRSEESAHSYAANAKQPRELKVIKFQEVQ